ncbi:NAD(P)/FAD-dependent oxidoreductase [Streptomyces sp. NPDC097610]|uniref:flavin-containing monooxygenase n=1 Tax=Streptomyces sp. NPDC097610 TaxID=3157227 RepID=UPI00331C82A7
MQDFRIAIIGGGASGIALAVKLSKAGFRNVTVFEAESSPGGTWHINTFPGCEVDVESHAYSFSFMPYDWSRNFASGAEVGKYLNDVIDAFDITDHFRCNVRVVDARWAEATATYRVTLDTGEADDFDFVVSCVGTLSNPNIPGWAEAEIFGGPIFHTAGWDHEQDLRGKTVALVGTGSTAAQVGPAIAPIVGELLHFQRSPTWIFPKHVADYAPDVRKRFANNPWRQKWDRYKIFRRSELRKIRRGIYVRGTKENLRLQEMLTGLIRREVKDPTTAEALTPDYPVGCKRPVQAAGFYEMYNRDNVHLVPHAVQALKSGGIIDVTGTEHQVDAIVLATGYTAQRYLASVEIFGRGGRPLHDVWEVSPKAFLGISVPDFPNFFMLYGPNCNGGVSAISQAEFAADAIVRRIRIMRRAGRRTVDTRAEPFAWFVNWVDKSNAKRTSRVLGQCSNYYYAEDGRNVTQWPGTRRTYRLMTTFLPFWGWTSTSDRGKGPIAEERPRMHIEDLPL